MLKKVVFIFFAFTNLQIQASEFTDAWTAGDLVKITNALRKRNVAQNELDQALIDAVKTGATLYINLLIGNGANVNARDSKQSTPLIHSGDNGYAQIIKLLLEKGADVIAQDTSGKTALDYAKAKDEKYIIKLLLQKDDLLKASKAGNLDEVKKLIENGTDVNARDSDQKTPLMLAAGQGHIDIVKLLLQKGANVNAIATITNKTAKIEKFGYPKYERNVYVETEATDISTPLLNAVTSGHTDVAKLLLEKGADVSVRGNIVRTISTFMNEYGYGNPTTRVTGGLTPLMYAASNGYLDMVKLLLQYKADFKLKSFNDTTEARSGNRSQSGTTARQMAEAKGYKEIVTVLKALDDEQAPSKAKADQDITTRSGPEIQEKRSSTTNKNKK